MPGVFGPNQAFMQRKRLVMDQTARSINIGRYVIANLGYYMVELFLLGILYFLSTHLVLSIDNPIWFGPKINS